jgi:hypothetical protein
VEANPALMFAGQNPFHEAGLRLHAVGLAKYAAETWAEPLPTPGPDRLGIACDRRG